MKKFLELVNFRMCIASIFPFIVGTLFSFYHFGHLNIGLLSVFCVCMLTLNFAVNSLDNYEDYQEAQKANDQEELERTVLYQFDMTLEQTRKTVFVLLAISFITGMWLVFKTGWFLLVIGLISGFVGVFYSQGKHPLSYYPVGEVLSGLIMGYFIILSVVYVNTYNKGFDMTVGIITFLVALPFTIWIGNILLANSICDEKMDIELGRRTLVYFIGVKKSLIIFAVGNVIALIAIVASVILKLIPWLTLVTLLLIPFIIKQNKFLFSNQDKYQGFFGSVNIMMVGSLVFLASFFVGMWF